MTRVSRQSLPATSSLDESRAGILEVNPLAHTTAKPDAASKLRTSCAACDAPRGVRHTGDCEIVVLICPTSLSQQYNQRSLFPCPHKTRDGGTNKLKTSILAPGQGQLEEGPGQR